MVLSQVVNVATVSTPACCCRCSARSSESEWVRALWAGWTANTPAPLAWSTAAACTASAGRPPDAIAPATMNRRPASWSARVPANGPSPCDPAPGGPDIPIPDITVPDIPVPEGCPRRALAAGIAVTALAAARMCAGVVPQQPPTRDTPASANRRK